MIQSWEDLAAITTVLSASVMVIAWLFRRIAIDPLRSDIKSLNTAITELQKQNKEDMEEVFTRLRSLETESTKHEERILTLLKRTDHLK